MGLHPWPVARIRKNEEGSLRPGAPTMGRKQASGVSCLGMAAGSGALKQQEKAPTACWPRAPETGHLRPGDKPRDGLAYLPGPPEKPHLQPRHHTLARLKTLKNGKKGKKERSPGETTTRSWLGRGSLRPSTRLGALHLPVRWTCERYLVGL